MVRGGGDEHRHRHLVEEVMKASDPAAHHAGQDQRQRDAAEDGEGTGAERDRRMLDLRVEADGRREHKAQRKGHHDDDMATAPDRRRCRQGRLSVKKRRKAMPSTTCGIISGDMKKACDCLAPGKAIARDGQCRGHREADGDRRGQSRKPQASPRRRARIPDSRRSRGTSAATARSWAARDSPRA